MTRKTNKITPPVNINSENSVKLLGFEINSKLNINKHITQLCKKRADQLNDLCKLKSFLNTDQRRILVNSFIYANYNYCPPVWNFHSKKSKNKIERTQYRALQFLHNDSDSDYNTLLNESDKCSMEVLRIKTMPLEIFESLNNLNTSFMKNIFNKRNNINRRNNLRCLNPHIWSTLPESTKEITSFEKFQKSINNCYSPSYK